MREVRQFRVTANYWGGKMQRSAVIESETPQMAALTAIWKRRLPKEFRRTPWARVPVYCTHAYLITREGARKLSAAIRAAPYLYALDMMLADVQQRAIDAGPRAGLHWLVWNGRLHHGLAGTGTTGLVLQDRAGFPSDVAGSW